MDLRKQTLLVGSTLTVMAGATIAPSLPQIQEHFNDSENVELLTRMILVAPALFIALGSPFAGTLTDKFGRIRLLIIGLVIYAIGGTAPLYLNDIYWIIGSRALLGIGVAALMTALTTLIGDYYDGQERSATMGLQSAYMALGGFVFLIGGGALADVGWRWPFAIYTFSLVVLPFAWIYLNEPKNENNDKAHRKEALAALPSHDKAGIFLTYALGVLFFIIFYMLPVQLPFYLKQMGVESNTLTGIALACLTLTGGIISIFYKRIKSRLSHDLIYTILFALGFAGYFLISIAGNYTTVLVAQILGGIGFGLFMPNANLYLMNTAPLSIRGRVIGGMTTAVFLGQFLSPIALRPLKSDIGLGPSYRIASFVMAGLALMFLFFVLKNRGKEKE